MFKLIAIRPLNGCAGYISKCLKIGEIYYFCNDYLITDDGISIRDEYIKILPEDFFSLDAPSKLQINVSAVVGMNGDGKSSLIELMMRLINNCAKHYRLADRNNLLRIEGVKAELYYLLDNVVYCIRETEKDSYTSLLKYADLSNSEVRRWNKLMTSISGVSRMKDLFYTIVSNYSHYAYNTNDFKEEWSDRVKTDEDGEKCWLYYLFHKNDGYRTPMTIHPYRCDGNIDVNVESELTLQRLMSLYVNEPSPYENENSFRRIGKKNADILRLTDYGYSKLQEVTIIQYFKDKKKVSSLSKVITQIEDLIKNYDDLIEENLHDNTFEAIEYSLDFLTGNNDASYEVFLSGFNKWIGNSRSVYSSNSDLRLLLNAIKKFNNSVSGDWPYDRLAGKYRRYDKLNVRQLTRLRYVYEILSCWEFPAEILFKNYKELTDIEKCQHYVVYKTIDICGTYPEYRDFINDKANGWNNTGLVFNNSAITEVLGWIKRDQSHVTLKLRQCLKFIDQRKKEEKNVFEKLDDVNLHNRLGADFNTCMLVRFDDLKSHYNKEPFPLDLLPPPIYNTDILYYSEQGKDSYIPYKHLSSGEKQLLNSFGALIYHLRNIDSVSDDRRRYENVNIILEETELYFHPEYQRMLVKMLLEKLHAITFRHIKRINILFVTHSSFILSDIPICNVLFLKNGRPAMDRMQENTFGANIHGLLKNGFFLPSLPIGEFAYYKINSLFEKLNRYKLDTRDKKQRDWFYSSIMRVGEPYLREQLMKLYNMHYPPYYND